MSFQIKNSNQFRVEPGKYTSDDNILVGFPGGNLPSNDLLPDSKELEVRFYLRRKEFHQDNKPKGYKTVGQVFNLPYKKQVKFVNSLDSKKLNKWYGASKNDIANVTDYLESFNASIDPDVLRYSQEVRVISAKINNSDFKKAFLANKPETIVNQGGDEVFYYNPNNFEDSYLESRGDGGKAFANAVIGVEVDLVDEQIESKHIRMPSERAADTELDVTFNPKFAYYPSEIAEFYNFPSHKQSKAGKGVTIGLIGSGGNQFKKIFEDTKIINKYLHAQGVNEKKLGTLVSPNTPDDSDTDYGESAMDYSILRSISPRSSIVVSENVQPYDEYAELIYDPDVDIISSSIGLPNFPSIINLWEPYHQLFLDALLRGKPIIVASGDSGTANNSAQLPDGDPFPSFSDADSAVLSVGGTSFSPKAQKMITARPQVYNPTLFLPSFSEEIKDALTGLIKKQSTWNEYDWTSGCEDFGCTIYPGLSSKFNSDDLKDAIIFDKYYKNTAGSSGVFPSTQINMPTYQSEHLGQQWLGTGRRYPDVSVLAGGNTQQKSESYYYLLNAEIIENDDKIAYIPQLVANGGTSAGAPLLTGLLANISSFIKNRFGKNKKLGMINPLLYEVYNSNNKEAVLIDVLAGSNNASVFGLASSPKQWPKKYAVPYRDPENGNNYLIPVNGTGPNKNLDLNLSNTGKGFDAATGLGSINGEGLMSYISDIFADL